MTKDRIKNIILLSVIIMLSAAAVITNLPSISGKSSGSFEYIRKGEALLDKSRYGQAIKYFEKAYDASPENEIIASDLAYAYSMYGRVLANQNKHEGAVEYFEKAYNVTPNSAAAQNAAMIYSEKALHEARNGRLPEARIDYARARRYASVSGSARRNLGVMLYNDAVAEFKSGREEIAILCLKESSLAFRETRTMELLGDIYYKKADLSRAYFYWRAAASLKHGNEALLKKIEKAAKELALAEKEREAYIPHFEIRYAEGLPIDKEFAAKALEGAYADIGKDLGYFPEEKTKVFFYSKKDFRNTFNMPYFVKAFFDGSIKMPAPETYLDKSELSRYIYHEYTHAILSAKTNNNCPTWLSEGIAMWEEYRIRDMDMRQITGRMRSVPEISFKFLDDSFRTEEIDKDKALSYIMAYTMVDFIIENWGMQGLNRVLKRLAEKQHIVNAIDDEFLMSEQAFQDKWRAYAMKKFFSQNIS